MSPFPDDDPFNNADALITQYETLIARYQEDKAILKRALRDTRLSERMPEGMYSQLLPELTTKLEEATGEFALLTTQFEKEDPDIAILKSIIARIEEHLNRAGGMTAQLSEFFK